MRQCPQTGLFPCRQSEHAKFAKPKAFANTVMRARPRLSGRRTRSRGIAKQGLHGKTGKAPTTERPAKKGIRMKKIIIIGGGAAGMMAAIAAAESGAETVLLEKNEKLGKKLYITGKGRCNVTNACEQEEFFEKVVTNPRFMYSAFSAFSNRDVMEFFEENGVALKTERGNRVFPVSDKSSDIIGGLAGKIKKLGIRVLFNTEVNQLINDDGKVKGVILKNGTQLTADACIVATGGLSYASTGSTGDGYTFAKLCGHKVTECFPSLVAFKLTEPFCRELEGLSLKNVELVVKQQNKELYRNLGEMVFTADGISGPLVLTASTIVTSRMKKGEVTAYLDLKPALTEDELDARLLRDFEEMKNRRFKNACERLLPQKLIPVFVRLTEIDGECQVNSITKTQRKKICECLKRIEFHVKATGGFSEAVITRGGVSVKEVNPSTMESKLCHGLYFAGEVLDLDAVTGGFNLQIAWSTGYLAGKSAALS